MKYLYNEELDKDVLHLPLFSIYTRKIFSDIINMKGVNMRGTNYNNLRYADDTALLVGNEKELSELTSKINEVGNRFGMKINIKKTKAMVVSKKPNSPKINIAIDGQQIEQVTSYMYIVSLITEDGISEKEIKRRIMIAVTTFTNTRTLLSCRGIHLNTSRVRAIQCYIWPTLWSRDMDNYKISVVQTWCLWDVDLSQSFETIMDGKITNEEILRRMGTGREIVRLFKTRKLQYLGYLIRHNTSQMQLIEGKIEGRRSRGRPRNTLTTDITTTNGMKYHQLKRTAEDRKRWPGLVVNLAQETTLR